MTRWVIFAGIAAILTISGCKRETPASGPSSGAPGGSAGWIDFPRVSLESVEPSARRQLFNAAERARALVRTGAAPAEIAQVMGETGMLFNAYENPDMAQMTEACYLNAQAGQPKDFRWPYYLGQLYLHYNMLDKAFKSFKQALSLKPENLPTQLALADVLLRGGRPDQSLKMFEECLALDPRNALAWYGLGRAHLAMHDEPAAISQLLMARILSPGCTTVDDALARAYGNLGDLPRAAEFAAAIGTKQPTAADPLMQELSAERSGKAGLESRAADAFRNAQYPEAEALFQQVVELNPDDAGAHANLAATIAMQGRLPDAMKEYQRALELDPTNAGAHLGLGTLLARQGRDSEAIEHYVASVRADQSSGPARLNLANALHRLHKFAEAEQQYERVIELEPDNVVAQYLQAVVLGRLGRYGEARSLLEQSLALRPNDPILTHGLARLLVAAPDDAVRDVKRGLTLARQEYQKSHDADHMATLAMAYAANDQWDEAIRLERELVSVLETTRRPDVIKLGKDDLAAFEKHQAIRIPWRSEDVFTYPFPAQPPPRGSGTSSRPAGRTAAGSGSNVPSTSASSASTHP